jgi:hypothetical protein
VSEDDRDFFPIGKQITDYARMKSLFLVKNEDDGASNTHDCAICHTRFALEERIPFALEHDKSHARAIYVQALL